MSIGHYGKMRLVDEDDKHLLYAYCCENLNFENKKPSVDIEDGEITVDRSALVEPEIHEYRKRARNGSKRTVKKRIWRDVAYGELLASGRITIKNASGTWRTTQAGEDVIALQLLIRLFDTYQDTGEIPTAITYIV